MTILLIGVGTIFFVFAVVAALVLLITAIRQARNPATASDIATTNALVDIPEIVKALSAAPFWLALAVVGAGLCILGTMYDGYRFADGGFTNAPAAVESAEPSASTGS